MTPALRLAISLVLSLLLWLPTVPGALKASEDPAWIAGRYLLSLLLARIGVGLVFRIFNAYAKQVEAQATDDDSVDQVEEERDTSFGRRRDDFATGLPPADLLPTDMPEEAALDGALDEAAASAALVP